MDANLIHVFVNDMNKKKNQSLYSAML